jgi:tRNA dimethylallyltransferase
MSVDLPSVSSVEELPTPTPGEVLVIVGPTASGKTELSLRLAERFDGELVNADSVQIVRGFDLGSGKPTSEERARAPHHLFDAVGPDEPIDAQRYAQRASEVLQDILARGRTPIVVGGTFLWVKALLYGLAPAPPGDPALRERHRLFAEERGREALHARLAEVDPAAAARLSPNDLMRVSRALEIWELSGTTQTALFEAHGFREARWRHRLLGLARSPEELDLRIEARARAFLAAGWLDEVRALVEQGWGSCRAMGSVGYKEVLAHLRGELPEAELLPAIVRATRVFVRRQRTWLRDEPVLWLR